MSRPLFTIVTPTLNCAHLLPRNLASVQAQQLAPEEFEHWIIDGGSQDGTVGLLQAHSHVKYISEKDRGLSDAVNKGIGRAAGNWIIWLNADDELAPGAFQYFKTALSQHPGVFIFCGAQKVFRYDGSLECVVEGWDYNLNDLLGIRTAVVQASTFVHRSVYEQVGLLDAAIRYAMDYEWIVRAAHRYRCQPLPQVLTHYHRRRGSIMDANMAAHMETCLQVRRRYRRSYFTRAEWRLRWYILTDPLRRILCLRRWARIIKGWFGREPLHPMS